MGEVRGTYPTGFAVTKAGIGPPDDSLCTGQNAGSLSFEEENALAQGLAIVMTRQGQRRNERDEQEQRGHSWNRCHWSLHINKHQNEESLVEWRWRAMSRRRKKKRQSSLGEYERVENGRRRASFYIGGVRLRGGSRSRGAAS